MPNCQRCYKETNTYTYSWYNDKRICMDCSEKEKQREDFKECKEAERRAVERGNRNYHHNRSL